MSESKSEPEHEIVFSLKNNDELSKDLIVEENYKILFCDSEIDEDSKEQCIYISSSDNEVNQHNHETKILLTKHEENHKTYKCEKCDTIFLKDEQLKKHNRVIHGERPYKCHVCDRTFEFGGHLRAHHLAHSGEKPSFKCDKCDKAFTTNYYLRRHKKTHSDEKPFKCDLCNKKFNQNQYLKSHKRSHKNKKRNAICVISRLLIIVP